MSVTFTLLQISDLHLGQDPYRVSPLDWPTSGNLPMARRGMYSSHDRDLLEAIARNVYQRSASLDAVLLSGDLATSGFHSDLNAASQFVYSPAVSTWLNAQNEPTLEFFRKPIFLYPGNHDRYPDTGIGAGGTLFDTLFVSHWRPNTRDVNDWSLNKNGETLTLIAADFCLKSSNDATSIGGIFGQGRAYQSIVTELELRTYRRAAGGAVAWTAHFPPYFPGLSSTLELVDESELIDAAQRCGPMFLFTGHTHEFVPNYDANGTGAIRVFCAGTACQYAAPGGNFIHQLSIEVDNRKVIGVSTLNLKWNQAALDFV